MLYEFYSFTRSASLDVEPLYTFRKHLSPVLCVAINAAGEECYSGCQDGHIYCWNVPSANIDPYDSYGTIYRIIFFSCKKTIEESQFACFLSYQLEPTVLYSKLEGHTDAVWGLSLHTQKLQLLSCSADGTVKLWSPNKQKPTLLSTYVSEQGEVKFDCF